MPRAALHVPALALVALSFYACGTDDADTAPASDDGGTEGSVAVEPDAGSTSTGGDVDAARDTAAEDDAAGGDASADDDASIDDDASVGDDAAAEDEAGADAARDAAMGTDAATDAGREAGSDAGRDAGSDGSVLPPLCLPAVGNAYHVDTAAGSDATGTGSTTCPFRSITRATAVIGASPLVASTITVRGAAPASAATGETFPIPVRRNVTVRGTAPARAKIHPGSASGFTLGRGSTLAYLHVDGHNGVAGLAEPSPANLITTAQTGVTLDHVTVEHGERGVVVNGGRLTLGPGVEARFNRVGMYVDGGGVLEATLRDGDPIVVRGSSHGLNVRHGALRLAGDAATRTIRLFDNDAADIVFFDPAERTTQPQSLIDGVVATGTLPNGTGLLYAGNFPVVVRNSIFTGHARENVDIVLSEASSAASLDLGGGAGGGGFAAGTPGRNALQSVPASGSPVVGVQYSCRNATCATVKARGNTWVDSTNRKLVTCTSPTTKLSSTAVRIGYQGAVDVATCTR